jgi:hypothetical protein
MNQQQENNKFLSHFKRKMVIKRGRRDFKDKSKNEYELFQMRANGRLISNI